jgi:hypothetical protein
MNKEIVLFWAQNENILAQYEEDHGLNGRDYILSIDNIDELKEILTDYLN